VEPSTFGSGFVAMKTAIEMIGGLRYKLRMMGVDIEGPTNVFCDNDSFVKCGKPGVHLEETLQHNRIPSGTGGHRSQHCKSG
jgi:hypothetical protein